MVENEIQARFGPVKRIYVIYNGVDLQSFHPRLREAHRAPAGPSSAFPMAR